MNSLHTSFRSLLVLACAFSIAQSQVPSVLLKVKEKSGFLGMGPPRFIEVQLSNQQQQLPLSSDNVNGGPYYYFLLRSVGGWTFDDDFLKEELPRLSILQDGKSRSHIWKGAVQVQDTTSFLLIGFPPELMIHKPFTVQFELEGLLQQAELTIPEQYWPGYSIIAKLSQDAERLVDQRQFREAIRTYNRILRTTSLEIFPTYHTFRVKRTTAFDQYYADINNTLVEAISNQETAVKDKIAKVDSLLPLFQFIVDSLPQPSLGITESDSGVSLLMQRSRETVAQVLSIRDSLQQTYNEEISRWIVKGSGGGKPLYVFEMAIKALAYTFASLNFADTTSKALHLTLLPEFHPELVKQKILEDCEAFLRMCSSRYEHGQSLFPAEFLSNLQKDTASFPMPYYWMMKAVNDFYGGEYTPALQDITKIFRTCNDPLINEQFDQMRIVIFMKTESAPTQAIRLIEEAEQAASLNDTEKAYEKYLQATIEAPDFAYGYYALGKFFLRTGDAIRALTFFQKAYQTDKQYLSAYRSAYNVYLREGNFKPMIEVLTLALQNGNNYWEIHSFLGQAYMGDNDPSRAIQQYEKALALNPKSYQTLIHLGLAYQSLKNFKRAREYYNKATELDPQRPEAVEYLRKLGEVERGGK